jgi:hypothetical protein
MLPAGWGGNVGQVIHPLAGQPCTREFPCQEFGHHLLFAAMYVELHDILLYWLKRASNDKMNADIGKLNLEEEA